MAKRKHYVVQGQTYKTQKELEARVKWALNSHKLDREFDDQFLAAVVNELHQDVIKAGQRAIKFIYLSWEEQIRRNMPTAIRFRGGQLLMAYFKPLNEWRDVTVYPWRQPDKRNEIKTALREIIASYLPKPTAQDMCSHPGCNAKGFQLEYEHIDPTFDEIANKCLELMTVQEIETRFGYTKFSPGCFTVADFIPLTHPAVKHLIEQHQNNIWKWLCKYHHRHVSLMSPINNKAR